MFSSGCILDTDFNPHSHAGSDKIGFDMDTIDVEFQSTLPRRE